MSHRLKILLIDDEPNDCLLVASSLRRKFGHLQITTVGTEAEYRAALASGPYDLVITDYHLPWTDGLKILGTIRENWSDCPVVMYTGAGSERIAVEAMKSGFTDYLIKSTENLSELLNSIAMNIEHLVKRQSLETSQRRYQELFESETRQSSVVAHSPEGVLMADRRSGAILFVNPAFCRLFDRSSEELLQMRLPELHPKPQAEQILQRAEAGNSPTAAEEVTCLLRGGGEATAEVQVRLDAGSGRETVLAYYRDVSDRRQQERRLRELGETLPSNFTGERFWGDLAEAGSKAFEGETFFLAECPLLDEGRLHVLGAAGHPLFPRSGNLPEPGSPWGDLRHRRFIGHGTAVRKEYSTCALLSNLKAEGFVGLPILGSDGSVIGCVASISAKPLKKIKLAKGLLQVFASFAAQRLAFDRNTTGGGPPRRKDDPDRAAAERDRALEARNRELEDFAYSLSHDLQAPVRHIQSFASDLSEMSSILADPEAQRLITSVARSAGQMQRMIADLLAFCRHSRETLQPERVPLNSLVAEVRNHLDRAHPNREVEWVIEELPVIWGDPLLLGRAFQNLLSNALKYTRTRPRARIEIASSTDEDRLVISVRDNGVGFEMESGARLFQVFQRLHDPNEFEGHGLGLASARRIIEQHQGRIWAESQPEKGATFRFSLPRQVLQQH